MTGKSAVEVWSEAVDEVERGIGQTDMILKQTRAESISNGVLSLIVPNKFVKETIEEEYLRRIRAVLKNITNFDTEVNFIIQSESRVDRGNSQEKEPSSVNNVDVFSTLKSKYTFDNFVVGPSNRFSYTASLAVAESPAKVYNPFLIYGGVGLGKTHLMHAIGNSIKDINEKLKIVYISSEDFTNQLIDSIRHGAPVSEFRSKYRNVDVLLIDDIQFIRGKDGTQEEFFHTFNTLYHSEKQIILTSDSHPRDIPSLEERLRSRFEWGLITVIQLPELETRIAILRKKSEELGISHLSDDVAMYIADRVTTNIRELEGCLIRVLALADLDDVPMSIDLVKEALKDIMPQDSDGYKELITAETIQKTVAKHFNIRLSDLKSKKRPKPLTLPRHVAMYLCRRLTNQSLIDIGRDFGKKDHTTVIHACNRIEEGMQNDPGFEKTIEQLMDEIKNQTGKN